jgi:hypothetical protein
MKRLLISVVTCSVLTISVTPVQAAPKLGATCKRVGEIAHITNGTLICSKVGKFLKYKSFDSNSAGSVNNAIPDEKVDSMVLKAYNAYNHAVCNGSHPNFIANYLASPTYKADMLAKQKVLFEQAMSCYSDYFDHKATINIAFVNESDYEFLASQKTNGVQTFDAIQLRWAKFMMERLSSGAGTFAGSAGWGVASNSAWVLMIDSSKSSMPDAHGAAHEFVHILQSYSKSVFYPYYGDGSSNADYLNVPNWFWEGTAELFSYASINSSAGAFSAQMAQARLQANGAPSLKKITNTNEFITTIKKLGAPSGQEENSMMYGLGSVVCEYLLGTYGYAKYFQIMQNAGVYRDFNENLKANIGITQDDFFAKAAPFVLSQWKLSNF